MKKSFISFALVGILGMSSCSETFNPEVDFGDNTYINDYTKLIEAVNDLNNSLGKRLDALNTLLEKGLYDIKVSINENTGAITLQTTALKEGLGTLNTTFLDGFSALNSSIQSSGEKIVSAINDKGDLIALRLDANGNLISTTIQSSTTAIIDTLSSNNKTLSDKIAALNTSLATGLVNLTVKAGEIGTQLTITNNKLEGVDSCIQAQTKQIGELCRNVLSGFTSVEAKLSGLNDSIGQLKISIDAGTTAIVNLDSSQVASMRTLQKEVTLIGGQIVMGVNGKGDLIANAVDSLTRLVDAKIFCRCFYPEVRPE